MNNSDVIARSSIEELASEFRNFEEIARGIVPRPGSIPSLAGMEVYGETLPLNGIVGGDHLIYVDFKKRHDLDARIKVAREAGRTDVAACLECCRRRAGIALIDVSGHRGTDAMVAAMFHQAFLLGVLYELDISGHVTKRLFENLNQRFYRTSKMKKFITAIYGEIDEDATFRFLLAAQPPPVVFSAAHDRFMDVDPEHCVSFPPLGTLPSNTVVDRHKAESVLGFKAGYRTNKWKLMGSGDILLLSTDGLREHERPGEPYFPGRLEQAVRDVKHLPAADIVHAVLDDLRRFAPPTDDVSLVAIKKL